MPKQKQLLRIDLQFQQIQTIKLPKKSEVLAVAIRRGVPSIWYEIEQTQADKLEDRTFILLQDGEQFDSDELLSNKAEYLGLLQRVNDFWHIYEQ